MKKRASTYRSKKVLLSEWNLVADKLTAKYAVLFGIERVGGYMSGDGKYYPAAFNVHVDGFCFRVDSIVAGIALLTGFEAGMDFNAAKGGGRGCVCRAEVEDMIKQALEGLVK